MPRPRPPSVSSSDDEVEPELPTPPPDPVGTAPNPRVVLYPGEVPDPRTATSGDRRQPLGKAAPVAYPNPLSRKRPHPSPGAIPKMPPQQGRAGGFAPRPCQYRDYRQPQTQ
eukprot:536442-Alexandrium_andersonii.AAC.1